MTETLQKNWCWCPPTWHLISMAPPDSTYLPGWGPHCRTVPSSPRGPKTQILRYLAKTQILCVPDWRARGCFLHVAVGTSGEGTALGGIYQAFPCHKRSFQNNPSAAETVLVSKNINSYELLKRGVFCPVPGRTPWIFKQAKHYCALSTLLMVSLAHKRSPRNKTDLPNGFSIHLLGKGSQTEGFSWFRQVFHSAPSTWKKHCKFLPMSGFCKTLSLSTAPWILPAFPYYE